MSRPKISTSRELAKLAGVSHISVSRAFRGDKGVSESTRQRILELAECYGYRPNPIHSLNALATNSKVPKSKLGTLAFVHFYPEFSSWSQRPHLSTYLLGMQAQAAKLGFQIEQFAVGKGAYTSKRLDQALTARGISGIIFGPKPISAEPVTLTWENYSCVRFTPSEWDPPLHHVSDDNLYGLSLILDKLIDKGYRRIGHTIPESQVRIRHGFQQAKILSYQVGIPEADRIPPLYYPSPTASNCTKTIIAWIRKHEPDCIICRTSEMKDILEDNGWRVPKDIGLVHQGIAPDVPDWTGYRPNQYAIGEAVVDLVVNRIVRNEAGLPDQFREVLLRGEWQEGTTTRK